MRRFSIILIMLVSSVAYPMWYGEHDIDEFLTFAVNTSQFSTGAGFDSAAVPQYGIYEDETAAEVVGPAAMAKLDDAGTVGFYTERVQLTDANFDAGKMYTIYITATVDGVAATTYHAFKMRAAPVATATAVADVPTVAEFEARSIVAADYVVVGDTIAGVTLVATTTASTNAETAIGNLNDFDAANDDVAQVTLVVTTTNNSDMVTEPATALAAIKLDHLMNIAVDTNLPTTVHDNSVIGYMLAKANVTNYNRTEDSGEGRTDYGDANWVSAVNVNTATIEGTAAKTYIETRSLATADYFLFGSDDVAVVTLVNGLNTDVVSAAAVADAAWQELIELFFTFDATATYGTEGGSVVDQIADNAGVATAVNTTVASGDTDTSFTLTAGTPDAVAYPDMQITVTDGNGNTSTETRRINTYTDGRVVTVDTAFSFTPAAGDVVVVERAYLGVSVAGGDATEAKQDTMLVRLAAIMSKAAADPSLGTYSVATDCLEAQQENPQGPPIID